MQVDVNSAANRAQLIRTQLTAAQGPQFKPKAELAKDGNGLTKAASTVVQNSPEIRTTRLNSAAAPTKTRTVPDAGSDVKRGTSLAPKPESKPTNPLEALLADWGKKDSSYDLDNNGIVGMSDLLMMLAKMGGGEPLQVPELAGAVATDPTRASLAGTDEPRMSDPTQENPGQSSRLDALLEDWGQKGSPHDLDNNGIVGMSDLLMLLAKMSGGEAQQVPELASAVATDPTRASLAETDGPRMSDPTQENPEHTTRLDALLEDWGKSDSPYDLDNNGIVGMSDLLMLLARMSGGETQKPNTPHGDVATNPTRASVTLAEPPTPTIAPQDLRSATAQSIAIGVTPATTPQHTAGSLDQVGSGTFTPPNVDSLTPTIDRVDRNEDSGPTRSELASQIRDMLLDQLAKGPSAHLDRFVQEALTLLSDQDKADKSPSDRSPALDRFAGTYQQTNLAATAQQLVRGLTDHGAMELRKFVQAGELSASAKRSILDQISLLRPGAQRVNLVG